MHGFDCTNICFDGKLPKNRRVSKMDERKKFKVRGIINTDDGSMGMDTEFVETEEYMEVMTPRAFRRLWEKIGETVLHDLEIRGRLK